MSQEDNSSPLYLASLASKMSPLSPDRPLSRSTPSLAKELKVIVIGSAGVGKTSLVKREAYGEFDEEPQLSVGTERHITKVDIRDQQIDLALYDTVGQERFRTVSSTLYRNAQAVLICFDCSSRASFEAVDRWYLDVERNAPQDALILLIVTKIDVKRVVKQDECRQKAAKMGVHLFETSARTGHNVRALFALIASALTGEQRLRAQSSLVVPPSSPMLSSINLDRLTSKRTDGSGERNWSFSSTKPGVIRLIDPPADDRLSTTDSKAAAATDASSCWSSFNPFPGPTSTVTRETSQSSNASSPRLHPSSSAAMLPIPIPEEGFSLAEVLIEHANQRARTLAGGLRRRNTVDQQDLTLGVRKDTFGVLETFAENSSDSQSSGKTSLAERGETVAQNMNDNKPQLRLCALGCGALLDEARTSHENDECWLRLCPCSLGCGQKFPMLDCVAHEREACKLRTVRCKCGQKEKAAVIMDHCASYNGKSISLWSETDVVHFLLSVFQKEQQRRMINFSCIIQGKIDGRTLIDFRTEKKLDEIILSDELIKMLETSLSNYSFISSTTTTSSNTTATLTPVVDSEYSKWIERPDEEASMLESKHSPSDLLRSVNNPGAKMLFGFNVVSAQRRFHMLAPSTMLKRVKSRDDFGSPKIGLGQTNNHVIKVAGSPSKLCEVDDNNSGEGVVGVARLSSLDFNQHDFARLWDNWHDQARSWMNEDDSTNKDGATKREIEEETTREVLVPLSLGSKTVAVKTLRFTDLKLNSQDLVGSGSFGSVYLGRYRGAQVAVKHLHYQEVPERDLLREAAVMTSVSGHPHVLRFLGVCLERPNICFVSEALQCSLEEWLRHDRGNHVEPLSEILRYAEEAASGLYHLHLEMVVHRDIAARNLLLDSGNPRRVKVCDFGLARVLPRRNVHSASGSFGGSPSVSHTDPHALSHVAMLPPPGSVGGSLNLSGPLRWMSPESLRPGSDGLTRFSFASDVYSLAITIWELLSRDVPYAHLQPHEAAIAVMMEDLRPPRAKMTRKVQQNLSVLLGQAENAKCVAQLVALLESAWDKDPVKRPTMRAIVNELSQLRATCGDSPTNSPLTSA